MYIYIYICIYYNDLCIYVCVRMYECMQLLLSRVHTYTKNRLLIYMRSSSFSKASSIAINFNSDKR